MCTECGGQVWRWHRTHTLRSVQARTFSAPTTKKLAFKTQLLYKHAKHSLLHKDIILNAHKEWVFPSAYTYIW